MDQYSKNKSFWIKSEKTIIRSDILVNPFILKECGDIKGKKILDLGCGSGVISEVLAKNGAKVIGIDKSKNLIESIKNPKAKYIVGNITKLSFDDHSFDIIVSSMVLLHLNGNEINKLFSEVSRVLKEGGKFIFSNVHPFSLYNSEDSVLVKYHNRNINYFREQKVNATLYNLNGKSFKINYFHHPLSEILNLISNNKFNLAKVIEPQPNKRQLSKYGKFLKSEKNKPAYIIFKLKK